MKIFFFILFLHLCPLFVSCAPDDGLKPGNGSGTWVGGNDDVGSNNGNGGTGSGTGQIIPGVLIADGKSSATYTLIKSCGYDYETPDHSNEHASSPFQHITQSYDNMLKKYVFDFHIHIDIDDDRGIESITDRQRNEIKTYNKSPQQLVGQIGEQMRFRWKFLLPKGMLTTKYFCHIHQIKGIDNSQGTADVSMPVITFTARSLSNGSQQLQLIYNGPTGGGDRNVYLKTADLADFLGEWVEVDELIVFGENGSYQVSVRRVRDNKLLLSQPLKSLNMWRQGSTGMRPKWGIYRSFGENGSLKPIMRDEILKFADFKIVKE